MSGIEVLYWVQKYPNEADAIIGLDMAVPQYYDRRDIPMLLFISDGSGGTGFSMQAWRRIPKDYLSKMQNGTFVELDCPHYVHNYEYERISREIKTFLDIIK